MAPRTRVRTQGGCDRVPFADISDRGRAVPFNLARHTTIGDSFHSTGAVLRDMGSSC